MKLQSEIQAKTLYVVATPIGNLGDLSPRAQAILQQVDCIAAEDTRHTRQLLQHFAINTRLVALHEHNERTHSEALLDALAEQGTLALVSDAGTPLVSDPGFYLIQGAHERGITVRAIPGPCAAIAALSIAGLPTDRFCFEGFLPAKAGARQQALQAVVEETRTLIFYEAPHRIVECLQTMGEVFGPTRDVALIKELTKTFETARRGSLPQLLAWLAEDANRSKGEFVIIIAGATPAPKADMTPEAQRLLSLLLQALPVKQAAQLTAQYTGLSKNSLYQAALDLQRGSDSE